MKKFVSTKLLLLLSLSTVGMPFLYGGKRDGLRQKFFKSNRVRYKRDRKTLACNKFSCRVNKKERKRKNNQEPFLEKLSKKNRARNKFLHNMVSNRLQDSHLKGLRTRYSNVNEYYDCNSEKIKKGGIYMPRGIIPMLIFMFIRAISAQQDLPECVPGTYEMTVSNIDWEYQPFIVPCWCTPGLFGVEYLQCKLDFTVPDVECEDGFYRLELGYIPGYRLRGVRRCVCRLYEGAVGLAHLDCVTFGYGYFNLVPDDCIASLRRNVAGTLPKNATCCSIVNFVTDENNITTIDSQCERVGNSLTEQTSVLLPMVIVGMPATLLLGCVTGALGTCGIKALCALKKRRALPDTVKRKGQDIDKDSSTETSTAYTSSEYASTSGQSVGATASETESITEYDTTTESSSSDNADEDLETIINKYL